MNNHIINRKYMIRLSKLFQLMINVSTSTSFRSGHGIALHSTFDRAANHNSCYKQGKWWNGMRWDNRYEWNSWYAADASTFVVRFMKERWLSVAVAKRILLIEPSLIIKAHCCYDARINNQINPGQKSIANIGVLEWLCSR